MPSSQAPTMLAARLHGPRDLRIERLPRPGAPRAGESLIRVVAAGICGSDLHTFTDGRIGDSVVTSPMVLGHEFAGVVEAAGADAEDGFGRPLPRGARVTVDPAMPCHTCEYCERGNPNLCENLHFLGTFPDQGCFREFITMPSRCCFPIPDAMDFETGVMLEPLAIAVHATDLARIRVGSTVAILGAGPMGLCLLQMAKLAGATQVFVSDKFDWRLKLAKRLGGIPINVDKEDAVKAVERATHGRGVDTAIEAAWADRSVQQGADMVKRGGMLVLVGIPGDDKLQLQASTVRRKGATILLVRRMKHCYPRTLDMAVRGLVDLKCMITHRVPLRDVAQAVALNAAYKDKVTKVIVQVG